MIILALPYNVALICVTNQQILKAVTEYMTNNF